MSTFTTDLKLENPIPFDPAVRNLWGPILNTGRSLVDTAIVGELSLNVGGAANIVLTQNNGAADQSRNAHYNLTGVLTGNVVVLWPAFKRKFSVTNGTSGAFTLSMGVNNGGVPLGTTVTVPQGATMLLMSDGTDLRSRFTSAANLTLTGTTTFVNGITMAAVTGPNGMGFNWDVNDYWAYRITNPNTGTGGAVEFQAYNSSKHIAMGVLGTGYTTALPYRQGGAYLYSDAGGGLSLMTGVNQPIYFVVNATDVGRWTGNTFCVGGSLEGAAYAFTTRKDRNGPVYNEFDNRDAGAAAKVSAYLYNGTSAGELTHHGTGFTTAGVYRQNGTLLEGTGAGGLTLTTSVNQPVYVGVNNAEVARFTSANGGTLMIGAIAALSSEKLLVVQPDAAEITAAIENSNAAPGAAVVMEIGFTGAAPDNNTAIFLRGSDTGATRFRVYSDGDVQNEDNSYGAISDIALKRDITDALSQWDDVKAMRLRKYRMIADVEKGKEHVQLGLIAQELERTSPGLVRDYPDTEDGEIEPERVELVTVTRQKVETVTVEGEEIAEVDGKRVVRRFSREEKREVFETHQVWEEDGSLSMVLVEPASPAIAAQPPVVDDRGVLLDPGQPAVSAKAAIYRQRTVDVPVMETVEVEKLIPAKRGMIPTGTFTKGIIYSVVNLKLLGAFQEAMARIETLEAEVSALKAKGL